MFTIADQQFMRRALELAGSGFSAPNPCVGCVVVQGESIVGEGFSEPAGGAHAEVVAMRQAGNLARGATAYVTLEPCNHQGRTGPCSLTLIAAGVRRVVFAVADPSPKAKGGGLVLAEAGVIVESGLLAEEASKKHEQFLFSVVHERPFVTVKAAITQDGFLAKLDGASKWISSPEARLDAHRLRAERGSVLVGRGTVQADDPLLTARIEGVVNHPTRIVLDPSSKLTGSEQVFNNDAETVWIREEVSIPNLLSDLYKKGIRGVLVEGGAETIRRFLEADLVEEIVLYVGNLTFGQGKPWHGGTDPLSGWNLIDSIMFGDTERRTYRR
ncbi:MAG: bifunctional diaminohydroxyphosphoribosylaminopyrimidine deaminase/5-amino-6-(5-phosphoribosylamino)uracil reductase RibD [Fimbriimonadaceae bacterium]|nr:MAG: bifunctional diaminohydroxyphosphoribosylaminopyrimidine deaminase/5-amino-6-(5-phosphoribosylamino)uracil reductase RibD [Fimbriimonadaceae bacterium]